MKPNTKSKKPNKPAKSYRLKTEMIDWIDMFSEKTGRTKTRVLEMMWRAFKDSNLAR